MESVDPEFAAKAARAGLMAAAVRLDQASIEQRLVDTVDELGTETAVVDVVLPVMRQIGARWASGQLGVAHEHVASQAVRGFFRALEGPPVQPERPGVVLACLPGELHDLPLVLFGALLREHGCSVVHLGENTPLLAVSQVLGAHDADSCVLASTRRSAFDSRHTALARMAALNTVFLAGNGTQRLDAPPGTVVLGDDFRYAAQQVASVGEPPISPSGVNAA